MLGAKSVLFAVSEICYKQSWAGIPEVVYGTSIRTLQQIGWNQIDIRAAEVVRRTPFAPCKLTSGVLESQCDALFREAMRFRE